MRVLHVYSGNMYGGVETALVTLARYRHACPEMEPHFALCVEGRLSAEIRETGAPVRLLGPVRVRYPSSVRRVRRALAELLRREAFDVVVCHSAWPQAIFGPVVRAHAVPLAFWLHGATTGRHWLDLWARRTRPDLALCNSHFTAGTLPSLYPGVRQELLYYPVAAPPGQHEPDVRSAVRAELDTAPDAVVIVQTSRMEAWKGQVLHLEALGRLRDVPGWVCWQVGGAQRKSEVTYQRSLRRLAESLGIADRVRFVGQRSDVPRLLAAADIHCQPNTGPEPFGIAFVEALLAGLPSVTTAMGGAQEIVDASCGILSPPGDPAALAVALRRLVTDADLRRSLAAAAPARPVHLCDPARQIVRLHEVLSSLAPRATALAARAGGSP